MTLLELGGMAVAEALRRANVPPQEVDKVVMGVNLPGVVGSGKVNR